MVQPTGVRVECQDVLEEGNSEESFEVYDQDAEERDAAEDVEPKVAVWLRDGCPGFGGCAGQRGAKLV
jgi:hypothetical protein